MSTDQNTKPESIALLNCYLHNWSLKDGLTPDGCSVYRNVTSFDIRLNGHHMATVDFDNPSESSILLAYRALCLDHAREKPIPFVRSSYYKAKEKLDSLLGHLNVQPSGPDESEKIIAAIQDVHEWSHTLKCCLRAVHPKNSIAAETQG